MSFEVEDIEGRERLRGERDALKLRVGVLEKALAEISAPPPSPAGRMRIWDGRHFHEPAWSEVPHVAPVRP